MPSEDIKQHAYHMVLLGSYSLIPTYSIHVGFGWVSHNVQLPYGSISRIIILLNAKAHCSTLHNSLSTIQPSTFQPYQLEKVLSKATLVIALFRSITMFCGIDNIPQNIPHIEFEWGEYFMKYYQSHKHCYGSK